MSDDRPSLKDAIQKAVDTIAKLNGMVPPSKQKDVPLDWIGDTQAETTLQLFLDGEY